MIKTSLLVGCSIRAKADSKKAGCGFAAYGWKSDLSDEEILKKLLSLNLEMTKK